MEAGWKQVFFITYLFSKSKEHIERLITVYEMNEVDKKSGTKSS